MGPWPLAPLRCALLLGVLVAVACKDEPPLPDEPPSPPTEGLPHRPSPRAEAEPLELPSQSPPPPASSAVLAFEKSVQARKLSVPAKRAHEPRLAFGKGVFAQLTNDALRVFDSKTYEPVLTAPLDAPRVLLPLADGALLAVGSHGMLRWEPGKKRPVPLPRPMLLPGAELYPDVQQADRLWVFDGAAGPSGKPSPRLSSYRLAPNESALLLPEQTIELTSAASGVFGTSREGVWLFVTPGHVERFGVAGLRLAGLSLPDTAPPTWVLPARRLDQSLWLDEAGQLSRVLVSPSFKRLEGTALAGKPFAADVGDEGRLFAAVVVTGEGPRFELQLLDAQLAQRARRVLAADAPTGTDDWIKVVTENQEVVVAPRAPLVAVGGPARWTIFDASGEPVFSKGSR